MSSHGDKPQPREPRFSIGDYQLVRVENVNRNLREYTYRARLKNRGAAISGARAVLTKKHGDFQVTDGELNFGPVGSQSAAPSLDTFSFRHHGPEGLPGHGQYLEWEITPVEGNRAPVANAGPDASLSVGQRARLDGSRSSDPDGDPLTFRWAFASKPAASRAVLEGVDTAAPGFVVDAPGAYAVTLQVGDGEAMSPPDTTVVTTPNTVPTANAGPDQTVALGARALLSGAGSSDADGDPLSFRWRLESRPAGSVAVLGAGGSVESSLVPDLPGRYVVLLTVNDGRADSVPDAVVISTENSAPVANAGADRAAVVGEVVTLDGSASSDVDGDSLGFAWSVVSRPAGSVASLAPPGAVAPTVTIDRAGSYRLRLVVNDGNLSSAPDDIEISTRNTAPVANAGADASAVVGGIVTLDGTGSTDVDGDVLTYAWSLTSVPPGSLAAIDVPTAVAPHFNVDRTGTYVAQLIVSDGTVASAADTVVVTTRNSAPVARAGADQSAVAGQRVPLDGTASSDPDGTPVSHAWALVAVPPGSTAVLENPASPAPWFVADRDGIYVAQLIVNDGELSSAPDTVSISTTNAMPAANAGPDRLDVAVGSTVTLDGTASSDPDGQPLSYQWSLVAVPAGSAAVLSDPSAPGLSFTADKAGDYVAQLVVSDGLLTSAPDTVLLRTLNRPPVAVAGADQSVTVGVTVTLDATGSSDPDGDLLTYDWQFVARPAGSSASLNAPALGQGAFTADVSGRFVVRVTVTDSAGAFSADDVDVDVAATARLDVPAQASWAAVQVGGSGTQDVLLTNSGGLDIASVTASASGDFTVAPQSPCLVGPLVAGGSCAIQVVFTPAAAGTRTGTLTVTSGAPGSPHAVSLSGDGRAASLLVSPASLAFGATLVGQSSTPASSTLTNDGIGDLEILSAAANGDFALGATAADRCQAGNVLAAGASCSLGATFSPTQPGARIGSITATARGVGDSSVVSRSVSLSGDGLALPVVSLAVTDADASEWGPSPGTLTLSRTGSVAAPLTVAYTVGGTAAGGADYTALSGSATFGAGEAHVVLTIVPLGDAFNEGTESVVVTLTDGADYDLGAPATGTVSIEDAYQEVTVVASDPVAAELALNPGAFTFVRAGSVSQPLTVNFTVGGSATPGADYAPLSGSVVIASGASAATVTVTPLADAEDEGLEHVVVTVAAGAYVVGAPSAASVSLDDDPQPRISVQAVDAAAAEGGGDTATLRFTRTGPTDSVLAFRYTVSGSATNDGSTDFAPFLPGDLSFSLGASAVDVVLTASADALVEGPESIVVTLLDGARYNLGASVSATVTIADAPTPVVSVTAFDALAAEPGMDPGVFRFARTGDLSAALTVTFSRGGSAVNGTDYTNIGGTVTFNVGQATADRIVMPINDPLVEGAEIVTVTLVDGANYDLGSPVSASVTIADQPVPVVTIQAIDDTASEAGDTGLFRFTRTGDVTFALSINIVRGGTAANGTDYSNISSTLSFAPGEATLDRTLVPLNDTLVEGSQTVVLTLQDVANYDVGSPSSATITIADQPIPIISIEAVDPNASETGPDTGTFRFTRVGDTALALTVNYSRGGTATGTDIASIGASVVFPAGAATVDRVVTPVTDGLAEGDETVIVTLTDGTHYNLGSPSSATVVISD